MCESEKSRLSYFLSRQSQTMCEGGTESRGSKW